MAFKSREMVAKIRDILEILEEVAPSHKAEDWDNPGLQVGDLSQETKKIFVALDPTPEALREASGRKAQLLLTHHPLIFQPISHLHRDTYPGNVILEALRSGISIVAAHTNLDVVNRGINDMLAELFGLQEVEVLLKKDASAPHDEGLGRIGFLPEPARLSAVMERVKSTLGTELLRIVGDERAMIRRVAVVGGAGGEMVSVAAREGADVLITGDVRHHEAMEAESLGLALIDGGHFQTEKVALSLFADHLKEVFWERGLDVVLEVYRDEKNPMRFQ